MCRIFLEILPASSSRRKGGASWPSSSKSAGKADGGSGLFGELVAERDTELARWDLRAPTQVMPCPGLRDALFVLQPGAGGARLGILEVEGEALEVSGVTANLGSLMGIRRLPETQLLMAEHDHGEMRIRSLPLPRGGRASNDWGHLGEGGTISAFPLRAPPRRVIGLECGAVLIMDERGRLFRWEERRGLLLGVDGWLPAKDTHLHHGASEWFAAFQGNHLRIRRLTAAGGLIAAEGEPEGGWALAAAVPRALAAIAPDGGTVFACVGRSIVPWGLPRRAYPEVGQDSPSGPGSATPGAGR